MDVAGNYIGYVVAPVQKGKTKTTPQSQSGQRSWFRRRSAEPQKPTKAGKSK
jgi:hypothetical protein